MIKIDFQAMGCGITVLLDNEGSRAFSAIQQVPAWFEEWEQALSRFRPDSELNQLNNSAGCAFQASPILWEVVQVALDNSRWTGGLVVPTVLNSLERAGYALSFDRSQPGGGPARQIGTPLADIDGRQNDLLRWNDIYSDPSHQTITLPVGLRLDLGGVAKGWAAQQTMLRLQEFGPVLVDAAGDISISGLDSDGDPWVVSIEDPLQFQESLGELALGQAGVATSGIDYRRWLQNGVLKHHIIDPRTGEPAETDLMTATILAPDVVQAEAAAKAVLILGSKVGQDWLAARPQLAAQLALQDGSLIYCGDIKEYLRS
ncbi:MAG: FAD:protein FMN transferase [Anaerolineaceae bacterium]|nr:FAD:protein FMN transferase [Anaerolineaceae bacterium]